MHKANPRQVSRYRFLRAYRVTFVILAQYLAVALLKRLLGPKKIAGFLTRFHARIAQKIVANILALKGLYIKVGQTLSIMTNFLPRELTEGLERLQDSVPPHAYEEVEDRFVTEFGKKPGEMFKTFETTPIASASLGQVHVATLATGEKLAVKLQYPNIDLIVGQDLKVLKRIFGLLDFFFPLYGIKQIYREAAQMILMELDYTCEGKNIEGIQKHFAGDARYVFPKVYWNFSTPRILTTGFIDGTKVSNKEELERCGIKPHDVAVSLIHFYCKQIFIDGLYHADPHPGNIIILPPTSTLPHQTAMVDFGATAAISPAMREGITLFVEGLIKKDTRVLAAAMKQMGFVAREDNEEVFHSIVDYFYGKIKGIKVENFREINISQFQSLGDILELKKMDISLRELATTFHIPRDWVLLERTLILMMGLVAHLDPHLNPMDIVLPYVEEFVLGKDRRVADLIVQTSKELILSYINLPAEVSRVLKKIDQGKISFQAKAQKESAEKIYRGLHQLSYSMLLTTFLVLSYFAEQYGDALWAQRGLWGAGVMAVILVLSLIRGK